MADKKKRLCPNIAKGTDGKPKCGKEFEFDPAEFDGRCPHCGFNVRRYDDERDLRDVQAAEKEAADAADAEKNKGKRKSSLGNLGGL
jgi:DNA-directed RNA polymerase subunit RPC12/RpoP